MIFLSILCLFSLKSSFYSLCVFFSVINKYKYLFLPKRAIWITFNCTVKKKKHFSSATQRKKHRKIGKHNDAFLLVIKYWFLPTVFEITFILLYFDKNYICMDVQVVYWLLVIIMWSGIRMPSSNSGQDCFLDFDINILKKGINPLFLLSPYGLNSTQAILNSKSVNLP